LAKRLVSRETKVNYCSSCSKNTAQHCISSRKPDPDKLRSSPGNKPHRRKIRPIEGKAKYLKNDLERDFAAAVYLSEAPSLLGFCLGVWILTLIKNRT
jgi:hypothetical protein